PAVASVPSPRVGELPCRFSCGGTVSAVVFAVQIQSDCGERLNGVIQLSHRVIAVVSWYRCRSGSLCEGAIKPMDTVPMGLTTFEAQASQVFAPLRMIAGGDATYRAAFDAAYLRDVVTTR